METGDGPKAREWINQRGMYTESHPECPCTACAGNWALAKCPFMVLRQITQNGPRSRDRHLPGPAVEELAKEDASLLVLGNTKSPMFPQELLPFTARHDFGKGGMKINFLVNYSWEWDLGYKDGAIGPGLKTSEVSRIDLIIRWGGRRRLSGFLPVQSVYSDFYVVDDYWPDFRREHVEDALKWYAAQDITLGG